MKINPILNWLKGIIIPSFNDNIILFILKWIYCTLFGICAATVFALFCFTVLSFLGLLILVFLEWMFFIHETFLK